MRKRISQQVQKRLRILGDDEVEAIYGRPRFTPEERELYFSLSVPEKAALEPLPSVELRIYFILQLGYFKARYLFFAFKISDVVEDARYVQATYFANTPFAYFEISKESRLKLQRFILDLYQYRYCDATERQKLETKAQQVAMVYSKPIYLFRELMQYLTEQRLMAPGYSFMQEVIGEALAEEQNRLITIAHDHLTPDNQMTLKNLLDNSQGLYEITRLKREPKDFGSREIGRELKRGEQIRPLYALAKELLPFLKISNENIKYYASLVDYYSVFRLKQLDESLVFIYLLCFVYHRYQKLHDNLINCLIYQVRRYVEEAKAAAKERVYTYQIEYHHHLQKAGRVLKLFTDESIPPQTPFEEVQTRAFGILGRSQLDHIADHITHNAPVDETLFQWEYLDRKTNQFKRRLRPILRNVDFAASLANDPLLKAIDFLKVAYEKQKSLTHLTVDAFPTRWLPEGSKPYLYTLDMNGQKQLLTSRYEFLLYRLLRNNLEAGDIFCQDSVRFRSFEDDLVSDKQWQQKEVLIADTGLSILKLPIQDHLVILKELLEERLVAVNERITSGENKHLEIKKRGQQVRWTLPYPQASESANDPFFDALSHIDISAVLHFANRQCQFMSAFEHVLRRYRKQTADDRVITACLVAWGTNMGLGRMGAISDIGYHTLFTTSDNFIRLETLREANDRVSNAIAQLPIFPYYHIEDALHSSSDGQKFETRIHTINARYSSKYFGLKKGIVAYTLVANHIPANARMIGADEHESHYVFDILYNNTTEVQPTIHSTDTHGTNEVNFAILHLFGYQFAPCYKDIYDKVRTSLYGFKHPSQYEDLLLKPIRKINENLIIDEWENIQRIMVSLALKTTNQSIIIGKLSAYARKNRAKRALWEYDNIIRSLYLLDYVDSLSLRRNVQQALNRGESYHQLRRAVSYANFGKLRFSTEQEQQLWNECSRLITNCIIFYNATILSHLLLLQEAKGEAQQVALLQRISPVAWQHINFYGRYEFIKSLDLIDMDAIIRELVLLPVKSNPVS